MFTHVGELPSVAIVTAADEKYVPYLKGWLPGVLRQEYRGKSQVYILNGGLTASTIAEIRNLGAIVLEIEHDIVNFKHVPAHMRTMVLRPELPEILPSCEYILWSDADTWFQSNTAVNDFVRAALNSDAAACVEADINYDVITWKHPEATRNAANVKTYRQDRVRSWYRRHMEEEEANLLSKYPMINSGMLCAKTKGEVWHRWRTTLRALVHAKAEFFYSGQDDLADFLVEQTSLNIVARNSDLQLALLPPTHNWLCHLDAPAIDVDDKFRQPIYPHSIISVLHLSGEAKTKMMRMRLLDENLPGVRKYTYRSAVNPRSISF